MRGLLLRPLFAYIWFMNTTKILSALLLVSSLAHGQATMHIWGQGPDTICPGDTITLKYKLTNAQPTANDHYIYIGASVLWQGNWTVLASAPKEKWPTSPDSVYVKKFKTATNLAMGNHTITSNGSGYYVVHVKNCACTIIANFSVVTVGQQVTLTAMPTGSVSGATQYYWDLGIMTGYQLGGAVKTHSYYVPGTYTVYLKIVNPLCQDTVFKTVTVADGTVGIEEYESGQAEPVYFDVFGNQTSMRPGEILIEQRGNKRRKIVSM